MRYAPPAPKSPYEGQIAGHSIDALNATFVSVYDKSGTCYLEIKPFEKPEVPTPASEGYQRLRVMLIRQPYATVSQAIEEHFHTAVSLEAVVAAPAYAFLRLNSSIANEALTQDIVTFCVKELTPRKKE